MDPLTPRLGESEHDTRAPAEVISLPLRTQLSPAASSRVEHPPELESQSTLWQVGWSHGVRQGSAGLDNLARDIRTQAAIFDASLAASVPVDHIEAMAIMVSTGSRFVPTNVYGYTGLMQIGQAEAAEVGLAFDSVVGPEQVENNALAGARLWRRHAERLDDDVPRDPLQIFLAHQLGSDAACQIFWTVPHDPDTPAHRVMRHSLPESVLQMVGWDPTFLEFYDYWHGKMSAIETLITRRDHSQVSRVSDTQRAQG